MYGFHPIADIMQVCYRVGMVKSTTALGHFTNHHHTQFYHEYRYLR